MSAYDDKLQHLSDLANKASEVASGLDESTWPDPDARARVQAVVAYAALVIGQTDPMLVSHATGTEVEGALSEFINAPEVIASQHEAWADRLLDALARLPPAQGREPLQDAKNVLKSFQRSAQMRLSAVERAAQSVADEISTNKGQAQEAVDAAQAAANARLDEIAQNIAALETNFEGRLQTYESNLETERSENLRLRGEQSEAFESAQTERANKARAELEALETELRDRAAAAVGGLERSREEVSALVDLVTTSTTSGGFAQEASDQKSAADYWRIWTIGLGLAAAGVAIFAVIYAVSVEVKTSLIVAKAAVVVALGGLAGYAAKQSAEHRHREVKARRLALELTAFGPFSQALNHEEKEQKVREEFIDRVFVGEPGLPDKPDAALTSGDVSLFGQLVDIVVKARK